jgi:uncharacterized protein YggU (UPF0235/DUF167 family)
MTRPTETAARDLLDEAAAQGAAELRSGRLHIKVRAIPKASRNEAAGLRDGRLLLRVTAAPEDGKANAALLGLLADLLACPPSALRLESGAGSRSKVFSIAESDLPHHCSVRDGS